MTRGARIAAIAGLCVLGGLAPLGARIARAQPMGGGPAGGGMPDLRGMVGRPLPVADLPTGTVTIRIARKLPSNAAGGIEVSAVVTPEGQDSRKQVATTGADGRATFDGLPAGASFRAEATVDEERLVTQAFAIPAQGGMRVMLIAGLGQGGAGAASADPHAGAAARPEDPHASAAARPEDFRLGAAVATVEPADGIPPGTLRIEVVGAGDAPVAGSTVQLAQVGHDNQMKVIPSITDAAGVATFTGLPTSDVLGYAAVVDHQGMRLGTQPFRLDVARGMKGRIALLATTADRSVLIVENRSRLLVEPREDALVVALEIILKNSSSRVFTAGDDGLTIPLPAGFQSGKIVRGGDGFEVKDAHGIVFRGSIPPYAASTTATYVQVMFGLLTQSSPTIDFTLPLPLGAEALSVLVPDRHGLTLSGAGVQRGEVLKDDQGNTATQYTIPAVAAGGSVALSVAGLPARDRTGQLWTAVLCLGLVAAATIAARGGAGARSSRARRGELVARRERLFEDLVRVERERRQDPGNAGTEARRKQIVAGLDAVYRDLAVLEDQAGRLA